MDKDIDPLKELESHRKSQKISLSEVSEYFAKRGFNTVHLEQQWRHVTGVLEKSGENFFLKLASTIGVAERTINEAAWNKFINSFSPEKTLSIPVPKVKNEGTYNGLFWFLGEYIDGLPLVLPQQKEKTLRLEENITAIAEVSVEITRIRTTHRLPNDIKGIKGGSNKETYLNHLKNWVTKVNKDMSDLYNFIEDRIDFFQTAPSHGDFVPWHILIDKKKGLHLIDGEHSGITRIKFYDLAYFYHRVYTKLKRPDIADEFIKQFKRIYKFSEKDEKCAYVVIAHRLIGGYFDAQTDNITSTRLQDELKERLFADKII